MRTAGHTAAEVGKLVEGDNLVVGSPVVGTLWVDTPHFVDNPVELVDSSHPEEGSPVEEE